QEYNIADIDYIQIDDVTEIPTPKPENTINGHEYVDLDLPSGLKWATCNVGASSPTEYGDYFAWGETKPKSSYTFDNCSTFNMNIGEISGNINYDAARANWGGTWRMPSNTEMEELINKCTWTWTSKSGINGYVVKGPNGNEIFLPAAGYRNGATLFYAGTYGDYWSSSPDDAQYAYELYFISSYWSMSIYFCYFGRSVRPVSD
ncbi:MAG: DUF1566 domain-containing protein, partial [Muribaculaceae bacterium]|nr:DUF1566 domain-containing protein [Muribaculaceae bacterium]